VKVDQLIKRRGKLGLIGVNLSWSEAQEWIINHMNHEVGVESVSGILNHFLIEPFCPHEESDEYYFCIQSHREEDEILFSTQVVVFYCLFSISLSLLMIFVDLC